MMNSLCSDSRYLYCGVNSENRRANFILASKDNDQMDQIVHITFTFTLRFSDRQIVD